MGSLITTLPFGMIVLVRTGAVMGRLGAAPPNNPIEGPFNPPVPDQPKIPSDFFMVDRKPGLPPLDPPPLTRAFGLP